MEHLTHLDQLLELGEGLEMGGVRELGEHGPLEAEGFAVGHEVVVSDLVFAEVLAALNDHVHNVVAELGGVLEVLVEFLLLALFADPGEVFEHVLRDVVLINKLLNLVVLAVVLERFYLDFLPYELVILVGFGDVLL